MVEQGVDGMCILANYSEQFLLSDIERETLVKLCLGHVAGRVPVIVTCSDFSSVIAVKRARQASDWCRHDNAYAALPWCYAESGRAGYFGSIQARWRGGRITDHGTGRAFE